MRGGLAVAIGLIILGVIGGIFALSRTDRDVAAIEDLFTALAYFAEYSGGRFPADEAELRASPFIEALPDGALRVRTWPGSRFGRRATGVPLTDLSVFDLAWGIDLAALRIEPRRGALLNADGAEVLLIRDGAYRDVRRQFSRDLVRLAADVRAAAAPTTAPAP